ncbi:hypothetical protein, partial [Escherichia coli]|uniref:hypothetical protein n=2 Tax=Escherichia coli TaxID=562 RepID=UPI002DC025DF
SLKTSIKTITYLSDTGCLEIQGASLGGTFLAFITLFIGDAGNTGNTTPTNEVLTDDISVSIIFLSG